MTRKIYTLTKKVLWKFEYFETKKYLYNKSAAKFFTKQTAIGPFKRNLHTWRPRGFKTVIGEIWMSEKFKFDLLALKVKIGNLECEGVEQQFFVLQLWPYKVLQPLEMQGCKVFHLKVLITEHRPIAVCLVKGVATYSRYILWELTELAFQRTIVRTCPTYKKLFSAPFVILNVQRNWAYLVVSTIVYQKGNGVLHYLQTPVSKLKLL